MSRKLRAIVTGRKGDTFYYRCPACQCWCYGPEGEDECPDCCRILVIDREVKATLLEGRVR